MLGLGETETEVITAMKDLKKSQVDILTLGQYLSPTRYHLPVERFVHPGEFEFFRDQGPLITEEFKFARMNKSLNG